MRERESETEGGAIESGGEEREREREKCLPLFFIQYLDVGTEELLNCEVSSI